MEPYENQTDLTYRIDEFIAKSVSKKDLAMIFDKVMDARVRGVSQTSKMIIQKYMSCDKKDLDCRIGCLAGLITLCLGGLTGDRGLSARSVKISKIGK